MQATKLSISEAARQAGVRRNTLYRKLESGKLSKETGQDGNPVIDLSELARVYPHVVSSPGTPPPKQPGTPANARNGTGTPPETVALRELVDVLKQNNAKLADELERERKERRSERDEAREERKRHLDMLEKAHLQLAAFRAPLPPEPPKPATAAPAPTPTPKRSLWARIAGRV